MAFSYWSKRYFTIEFGVGLALAYTIVAFLFLAPPGELADAPEMAAAQRKLIQAAGAALDECLRGNCNFSFLQNSGSGI